MTRTTGFLATSLATSLATMCLLVACGGGDAPPPEAAPEGPAEANTPGQATVPDDAEALSLFGAPLRAPALPDDVRATYEANLEQAKAEFDQYPDSALAWIWVGRREAYLGNYRRAIAQFSRGFEIHPEDARFLRHRGHRYISTRRFEDAISDLGRAATMQIGQDDRVEPDGLPNARGIPTSTLQYNIWYHLALAHYLRGDFEAAVDAWRSCLEVSTNPDAQVATRHWLYTALQRDGQAEAAAEVLEPITADMDIIENQSYHDLLLMYKGERTPGDLLQSDDGSPAGSARVYGVAAWHLYNGDEDRAVELFRELLSGEGWAAFGYIAAEADLRRMRLMP